MKLELNDFKHCSFMDTLTHDDPIIKFLNFFLTIFCLATLGSIISSLFYFLIIFPKIFLEDLFLSIILGFIFLSPYIMMPLFNILIRWRIEYLEHGK